jgi:acetyl esterase/lipase
MNICALVPRTGVLAVAIGAVALVGPATAAPFFSYSDLLARPRPLPTRVISYGLAPQQRGELFLPSGKGPFPVVVLIHGGCWRADLPGVELTDYAAADLQHRGDAVWNVEYRRIGNPGGGYPGTFLDIAEAIDLLRPLAFANALDLGRVVLMGHSAGGHLALWAAARRLLPKTSALYRADPLPVAGVISLAGIGDLEAYRSTGPIACGGPATIDQLVGPPVPTHADAYADTSPVRLLPLRVPSMLVSGSLDPIVPARFATAFATRAGDADPKVRLLTIAGSGHFELIDPRSAAWQRMVPEIDRLMK